MHAAITAGSLQEHSRRIEAIRQLPDANARLVAQLHEQAPLYAGRHTAEVEELRGRILQASKRRVSPGCCPVVLEELETGIYPATVAAAGRALRGTAALPAEDPTRLVEAISRLRARDEVVRAALAPNAEGRVTALEDLAATLALLGPRARSALPVTEKFERRLWREETVLDALRRAARSRRTRRPADEADRLDD